jgi:hypothetical protein
MCDLKLYLNNVELETRAARARRFPRGSGRSLYNIRLGKVVLGDISRPETLDTTNIRFCDWYKTCIHYELILYIWKYYCEISDSFFFLHIKNKSCDEVVCHACVYSWTDRSQTGNIYDLHLLDGCLTAKIINWKQWFSWKFWMRI